MKKPRVPGIELHLPSAGKTAAKGVRPESFEKKKSDLKIEDVEHQK